MFLTEQKTIFIEFAYILVLIAFSISRFTIMYAKVKSKDYQSHTNNITDALIRKSSDDLGC